MYGYSHLLVCCFVVLLVLVLFLALAWKCMCISLLGLLFCWVVVVGLLFWLWHAGVGIYMHSFVYCLWFLVFLCRSDICFIYICNVCFGCLVVGTSVMCVYRILLSLLFWFGFYTYVCLYKCGAVCISGAGAKCFWGFIF